MKAPPKYVLNILSALGSAGHEAVLAGGCVRDSLLGRRPSDWDAATSAMPEEVLALFPRCVPTGIKHGTVTVPPPAARSRSPPSAPRAPTPTTAVPTASPSAVRWKPTSRGATSP